MLFSIIRFDGDSFGRSRSLVMGMEVIRWGPPIRFETTIWFDVPGGGFHVHLMGTGASPPMFPVGRPYIRKVPTSRATRHGGLRWYHRPFCDRHSNLPGDDTFPVWNFDPVISLLMETHSHCHPLRFLRYLPRHCSYAYIPGTDPEVPYDSRHKALTVIRRRWLPHSVRPVEYGDVHRLPAIWLPPHDLRWWNLHSHGRIPHSDLHAISHSWNACCSFVWPQWCYHYDPGTMEALGVRYDWLEPIWIILSHSPIQNHSVVECRVLTSVDQIRSMMLVITTIVRFPLRCDRWLLPVVVSHLIVGRSLPIRSFVILGIVGVVCSSALTSRSVIPVWPAIEDTVTIPLLLQWWRSGVTDAWLT